ncbi:response regulator transcription factor [Bosea sp. Root483D1]|uniref:response regulator transcription factor n=1 Tax=Bosea sp. Root483D1 TaxID=1736544 RepID=UPI000AB8948F|nr:response regulator [Bosea sp. Root483D1]
MIEADASPVAWTMTKPDGALIAIIDDDAAARDAVASLVSALGYQTFTCNGAAPFLASGLRHETRCVVADIRMPGMSGLELYGQLARSGRVIPTILMTAYPDETTRASALAVGVHGYLTKPLDPEILLACLRAAWKSGPLIPRHSATDTTV